VNTKVSLKGTAGRVLSLPARERAIFFVLVCAIGIVLALSSFLAFVSFAKKLSHNKTLVATQEEWLSQKDVIEGDIEKLTKDSAYARGGNFPQVESNVESIAKKTRAGYSFGRDRKETIGNATIYRLKVSLNGISMGKLIDFAREIEYVGTNVTISEFRINAKDNELLDSGAIISVLSRKEG
jgi:hypothetical protein